MRSSPAQRQDAFAKIAPTVLLLASLPVLVDCETLMPRQSWSREWGHMVPHESFPGDCGICHVPSNWEVLRDGFEFDHEKETGVPLVGAHADAACLR